MKMLGDWDEIFSNAETECFIGREQELSTFRQHVRRIPPRYLVFYIAGQGGVGKTTLLNRYRENIGEMGFLSVDCDEQQRGVPAVLGRFSHQLAEHGFSLKHFDERYKVYRQKINEIENDPEAPQGLAALLGRTVVRAAFIGGDLLPGVRKGLEYIPRESFETQASEWATYLAKKLSNKDDIALLREPTSVLTSLFFEDLNEVAKKQLIFLCFDNFEATRQELQGWLLQLREYKPSQNIRIIIAGRDQPGAKWDILRKVTLPIRLDVFTEKEAEAFLDAFGITDADRRREILECSGRLPVLMSWLSVPEGLESDPAVPTHDIVERFLRWVPEPTLRQTALLAAIPRTFNLDILMLLNDSSQNIDVQVAFDWLLTMPFVQQRSDGWQYHKIVRRMMLRYQKQKSPQTYQYLHIALANFYKTKCSEISSSTEEEWSIEEWRTWMLSYAYYFLIADPIRHWSEIISLFTIALRKRRSFAVEMVELLNSEDVRDELSREQKVIVEMFRQQLEASENDDLEDGFKMFDKLCSISSLSPQAKCYALGYRGECYRAKHEYQKALTDFAEALQFMPEDAWTIASRGQTYKALKQYEKALTDFMYAITLDKTLDWSIEELGETYFLMGRYKEALVEFNRIIALDETNLWAIVSRGQTYRLMRRYKEALADFNRVLESDDTHSLAFAERGETNRLMKHYKEALADFDRAIALDDKYAWAIASRGQTYKALKYYKEALADFNRAIALDDKRAWIIAEKGEINRLTEHYEEALVDFNRYITVHNNDSWAIAHRGAVYSQLGYYEKAFVDFDRAIALNDKTCAYGHRGEAYQKMGRYEEALADFNRAIVLDEGDWIIGKRGETNRLMGRYEEALADFNQAIAVNEEYAWAIAHRGIVHSQFGRYEEAFVDFDRAIKLDNETCAYGHRGETYQKMGRYEEALADFDRAIAFSGQWHNYRGLLLCYLNRYAEAIESYELALKEESNIYVLYNIAIAMVRWKGVSSAQKYIDEARAALLSIEDSRMRGPVLYGLGGLEAVVGDPNLALDYLQQALIHEKEVANWARYDMAWHDLRTDPPNPQFRLIVFDDAEC